MLLKPDDAYALRMALEPLTQPASEAQDYDLALMSIAISLKRIADAIEGTPSSLGLASVLIEGIHNITRR